MRFYLHGCYVNPDHVLEAAQAAEAAGYDGQTVSDHVVYPRFLGEEYPQDYDIFPPDTPWPDPWVTMAHLAAGTERLRFLNTVYIAPMREPIQAARLISTAAILSNYRIDIGVAQGWMKSEFEVLGAPHDKLASRLEEIIEVYRTLWSGGWVEHHGEYYDFPLVRMDPAPKGPMPLMGGGDAPRALRRAAGLDGFVGSLYGVDKAIEVVGKLQAAREEAGTRDREDYEIFCGFLEEDRGVPTLDDVARLEEAGYTAMFVAPWETSHPPINRDPGRDELLRAIDRFAADVIHAR